ncbi:Acid sphingomyelinase-like phosphodiesterase 3b [Phytophthora pseudosyringae]|uniref:Acid sphingomyelinase-like phosphodiesterase 3b n=1 Tax=Phytophthora pseudosyringae TaxID=221518 RepID=A0A8T1VJZ5_9STRA|nr:Acid sphingomyelinase-like phosphodiesterase 3b [Phytophthora pseudosyringae]
MTSFLQIHHREQASWSVAMRCAVWLASATIGVVVTSTASSASIAFTTLAAVDNSVASKASDSDGADAAAGVTVRHILHFSDVHLNISESLNDSDSAQIPIAYGDDAPISLLVSALEYAKKLLPDPDFFLYTGDHAVHGELSDEYLAEAVEENVETMAEYYSTADNDTVLDVTAIIGNADTSPDYTMNVTDPETEENPTIALISGAWNNTMSKSNLDWFNRHGYLAYALDENLVVITLNTLPYSPQHLPDTSKVPDPFEQFEWLNASLSELRGAGKLAYIVGHIPPIIDSYSGSPMWNDTYIKTYKQIVSQYTDIIKAQFFGHVHSIEFRLPLSSGLSAQFQQDGVTVDDDYTDSSDLVPLFMVAAISPIFLNNPAFMVWDFDATTYDILDFTVYGGNISSATQDVDWKALFQASTEYGVSALNTSEITSFAERAAADAELLEQYYFNSQAQSRLQSSCLDAACQAKWMCSLYWWSTVADFNSCVMSTKASKSKDTSAIQNSIPSSAGSLLFVSAAIILGGMAATAIFVLVSSRVCRRGGDQEASKLLQRQRVHFAAMV